MAKCIVCAYARIGKLYLNFLKVLIIFEIFQVLIIATDRASSDQDHISLSSELNAITALLTIILGIKKNRIDSSAVSLCHLNRLHDNPNINWSYSCSRLFHQSQTLAFKCRKSIENGIKITWYGKRVQLAYFHVQYLSMMVI